MKIKTFSEKQNIFFGFAFSYIALAISLVGSILITPVVLNSIGDRNYGLLSFCNSITTWLTLISEALGASYVYFATKEAKESGNELKTNTLFARILAITGGVAAIITVCAVLFLKYLGFQFRKYSSQENDLIFVLLIISGLNVAISILFSTFRLYNNYKKSFIFVRGLAILITIIMFVGNFIIAMTIKSIVLIAILSMGLAFIQGLCNFFYALKVKQMMFAKWKGSEFSNEFNSVVKYSKIILIGTIIGNLDANLDQTLLGWMVNAETVTMYHLSITFDSSITVLAWSFIETFRPRIHEFYRHGLIDEANDLFLKICKYQSIIVLFVIGGFISCGYHFVTVWIGSQRIAVYFYSCALYIARIVPLTKQASGEAYRANNYHKITMIMSLISITINLVLSIILLVVWDDQHAVWACIIGTIIPLVVFQYIIVPIVDIKKLHLPIKKYYFNLLKNIGLMVLAIMPAIVEAFYLERVSIPVFYKVLIEGSTFALIYAIEMFFFERKAILSVYRTYFRKKLAE